MFSNKEIEAKLNDMQKDISQILQLLQDTNIKIAEQPQGETPFLTKEGLYNYKHRKAIPKEE